MRNRMLLAPVLAIAAFAGPPSAQAADTAVCNQAENSHRGGYALTDGPVDPTPPAFNRGVPMAIGGGAGVERAAEVSPALRQCEPEDGGGPTPV